MKVTIPKAPAVFPQPRVEGLPRGHARSLEAEKERLRKATKDFESFFNYYMLKTMRQTIPKSAMSEGLSLGDDMGKDTFTELFDMEIAKSMNGRGNRSIADMLYKSMEKTVVAQYKDAQPDAAKPVAKKTAPIPITTTKNAQPQPIKLKNEPIALPKASRLKPLAPNHQPATTTLESQQSMQHDSIISKFGHHIDEAAKETKLDSTLIASVIRAESGGDTHAVSKAGAKGLMQLVDSTASDYGVRDAFNPRENIKGGSRFLKYLMDRYQDVKLALAAYNAGPGNVDKYNGVPPFKETQDFVQRVTSFVKEAASGLTRGTPKEL